VVDGALIGAHAKSYVDDRIGGVAGRILPPGEVPTGLERNPKRIAKTKLLGLIVYDNFDSDVQTRADHVRGCNMSFRREALVRAGGFDTDFGGSAHLEETDVAKRVTDLGYEMVFEPRASLVHLLEPVGGCRPKNMREWFYWYGHNFCLFYRKNYPFFLFPVYFVYFFCKLPFSAIKRGDARVVFWGLSGFFRCLFQRRETRLDVFN
jgi:GT2 family glycosyltransferase